MNAPLTVTVHTLDHGPVTVPEPAWCLGRHAEQNGGYRTDIVHDGPETALPFRGFNIMSAGLVAWPRAEVRPRGPFVSVEMGGDHISLDPAGLDELAALLIEHAGVLRKAARELAALPPIEPDPPQEPPVCGARRPGWDAGPAVGRRRLPCTLLAGHEGDEHSDGLGHTWTESSQ